MSDETRRLRTLDFFMGLGFTAAGIFLVGNGIYTLKDPALVTVQVLSNPGMSSLFIGGLLIFLGIVLTVIGWSGSRKPFTIAAQALSDLVKRQTFWRGVIVIAVISIYFFVLWGRVPYWLGTMAFLMALMFIFKAGKWWQILLISGVSTALVVYFFGVMAQIPLP